MSIDGVIVNYSCTELAERSPRRARDGRSGRGGLAIHRLDGRLAQICLLTPTERSSLFDEDLTDLRPLCEDMGALGSSIAVGS